MKERHYKRLPYHGPGVLTLASGTIEVHIVNISRRGACLSINQLLWSMVEDLETLEGELYLNQESVSFTGRVCWSTVSGKMVRFGIEFLEADFGMLFQVVESLKTQSSLNKADLSFW